MYRKKLWNAVSDYCDSIEIRFTYQDVNASIVLRKPLRKIVTRFLALNIERWKITLSSPSRFKASTAFFPRSSSRAVNTVVIPCLANARVISKPYSLVCSRHHCHSILVPPPADEQDFTQFSLCQTS
ncbi:unnamed protein product [Sphagnum jensenii]